MAAIQESCILPARGSRPASPAGRTMAPFTAQRVALDAARAAGFRDLLAKPFDLDTLERQVRALLP